MLSEGKPDTKGHTSHLYETSGVVQFIPTESGLEVAGAGEKGQKGINCLMEMGLPFARTKMFWN